MSWKVEYGVTRKKGGGRALLWILSGVLIMSVLALRSGMTQTGQAVEAMAVHLQEGMPVREAIQTFCQEVFYSDIGY